MFVLPLPRTVQSQAHRVVAPQLTRALDRLLDDSFDRYFGGSSAAGSRGPALDVTESDTVYTLVFDVPGASREQLNVSVAGRRVTLETVDAQAAGAAPTARVADAPKAEAGAMEAADAQLSAAPTEVVKSAARVLYRERGAARYARTVSLPSEVDQAASQARFENGVLTLTLVKKVPSGATRLSID